MKKEIQFSLLILISISCATDPGTNEPIPKMVPDHTPYIAGLIEASPDTTHHYPEIVVGYFTDIFTNEEEPFIPGLVYENPGIYNPTLFRQLNQTSISFGLQFKPEPKAKVNIRGPLKTDHEKRVNFTHEGDGIYGDQEYNVATQQGGEYILQVELPDGRVYQSETYIPAEAEINLPDSISVDVKYEPFADGTPRETDLNPYKIVYKNPPKAFLTVKQYNSSLDRELLLLEPDEGFEYTDRSNYLRTGIGYSVRFPDGRSDTMLREWSQNLDKPREEIWTENHWWMRFSFFSEGIGRMFFPLVDFYVTDKNFQERLVYNRLDAAYQNDSTYLFDVSTIRKIGDDGDLLPKEESDAIGFFGGYYSRYIRTTFYPIRNFDLDSVLTANGQ